MPTKKYSYREQDRRDAIRLALQKAKGHNVIIQNRKLKVDVERHAEFFKSLKSGKVIPKSIYDITVKRDYRGFIKDIEKFIGRKAYEIDRKTYKK